MGNSDSRAAHFSAHGRRTLITGAAALMREDHPETHERHAMWQSMANLLDHLVDTRGVGCPSEALEALLDVAREYLRARPEKPAPFPHAVVINAQLVQQIADLMTALRPFEFDGQWPIEKIEVADPESGFIIGVIRVMDVESELGFQATVTVATDA